MTTEPLPETLQRFGSMLRDCLDSLRAVLARDDVIPPDTYNLLAGMFTQRLNLILKEYPDLTEAEKDRARPHILYWR